jgi:transposase
MSDRRTKYDEEFKKNAVQLSYASTRSVRAVAEDLGISEALLYRWRKKYTKEGEKTPFATLEEENRELRKKLAESNIEVDMLRKAAAYFASLHKNGTHS